MVDPIKKRPDLTIVLRESLNLNRINNKRE